jgi:hypothetical protein
MERENCTASAIAGGPANIPIETGPLGGSHEIYQYVTKLFPL